MALGPAAEGWQAGAAKRIITPKEPMWMAAMAAAPRLPAASYPNCMSKPCGCKLPGSAALVLTLDLVGIDRTLSQRIRKAIGDKLSIEPNHVLIATSHTHSGPVVGKNLSTLHYHQLSDEFRKQIDAYETELFDHCVACAAEARSSAKPARLSWGTSTTDFATNRRTNKEAEVPELRTAGKLQGPFDHDVPVLAVRNAEDKLTAILFGYACHSTVLSGNVWSADYPGYAQATLEATHPGAVALFWAGCGADQNPLPRRTPELAEHYGRRLAAAVDRTLMTTRCVN